MRIVKENARVRVPATSGNLGSGFDCLGMAHDLWDEVFVSLTTGPTRVTVLGEGKDTVPRDESHLIITVINDLLDKLGLPRAGLDLICRNHIPHGRGLGSSAAAVVAGIMLVRGIIDQPEVLDDKTVLELATSYEGHPDNAAPCIYGGATLSWVEGKEINTVQLPVSEKIHTTLLVPQEVLSTAAARTALPEKVPHTDAVFNLSRAALLVHALEHRPDLLFSATADRLHQNYRAEQMPHSADLLAALRKAGWPTVVSGAGPTLLLFAEVPDALARTISEQGFTLISSRPAAGAQLL